MNVFSVYKLRNLKCSHPLFFYKRVIKIHKVAFIFKLRYGAIKAYRIQRTIAFKNIPEYILS